MGLGGFDPTFCTVRPCGRTLWIVLSSIYLHTRPSHLFGNKSQNDCITNVKSSILYTCSLKKAFFTLKDQTLSLLHQSTCMLFPLFLFCCTKKIIGTLHWNCGTWWRNGWVDSFQPEGRGFDSRSSRHVGTLGKSLTHSCLWCFGVKLRHSIRAVSGALLSRSGLEEAL